MVPKHLSHLASSALWLLLLLPILATSCESPIASDATPIELKIVQQSATDISIGGTPSSVTIGSSDFTTTEQRIVMSYSATDVSIKWQGQTLVPEQLYSADMKGGFTIQVAGLTLGTHNITFKVTDNGSTGTVIAKVTVREKLYQMILFNEENKSRPCGQRVEYDFKLIDPDRPNAINANYTVWAKVVKGRGVVQMMSNEMLWNDTLPGFVPQSCIVPNETWGGLYTGCEVGENQVEFTIEDKQKRRTVVTQTFIIDSSDFTISKIQGQLSPDKPDTIEMHDVHKCYIFTVGVLGNYSNKYSLSVEWDSPYAQHILIGDETLKPGEWSKFTNFGGNDPNYGPVLVPLPVGGVTHKATILVRDRWETIKRIPVSFHMRGSGFTTDIKYDPTYTQFESRILNLKIKDFANDDQALFTYRYIPVPGYDCSGMMFYNTVVDNKPIWQEMGKAYTVKSGYGSTHPTERQCYVSTYISFVSPGTKVFDVEVTDRFGVKRLYRQQVEIKANLLSSGLNKPVYNATVSYMPARMDVQVNVTQGSPTGITLSYKITTGAAIGSTFTADGVVVANGSTRKYTKLSDISRFEFDPSAGGRYELEITITLPDGRTTVMRPVVNAIYQKMKFEVNAHATPIAQGEKRGISLSASQLGHTDQIRWRYRFIEGEGLISLRNDEFPLDANREHLMTQTTSDAPFLLDYSTPSYAGPVKIEFTALDKDGIESTGTVEFSVTSTTLSLAITDVPTKIGLYDTFDFKMKLDKPFYTGKIKVEYTTLTSSSSYTGRGSVNFVSGTSFNVNTYTKRFTPSAPGRTQITFVATDERGQTARQTLNFEITPPALKYVMSVPAHTAAQPNGGESSFTFTVSEDQHPENFEFEFTFNRGLSPEQAADHPIYLDGVQIYDGMTCNIAPGTHTFKEVNNGGQPSGFYPNYYSPIQEVKLSFTVRDKYNQVVTTDTYCLPNI